MSIKALANNLQSHGRGNDTMLIHMSPREVGGLQALAKAHGGSLTKNPSTGLPEANFLESILPTVIGLGITAATGGAAAPWMIGAGVGAGTTLLTGSLEKGLLAGLGAAGGAGIGESLMGAGAAAGAESAALGTVGETATGAVPTMANSSTLIPPSGAGIGPAAYAPTSTGIGSNLSQMGSGLQSAANAPGTFLSNNMTNLGMAAAPILGMTPEQPAPQESEDYIRPYDYSQTVNPEFGMPGQSYFSNQTFTAQPAVLASDFTGFADGGIAELPQRYTQPVQPVNPAVTDYNRQLMNRANYEYNQSPQLGAFQSAIQGAGAYNPEAAAAFQARRAQQAEAIKQIQPTEFGYQYDPTTGMSKKMFDYSPSGGLAQEVAGLRSQLESIQSGGFQNYYGDFNGGFGTGPNDMGMSDTDAGGMGDASSAGNAGGGWASGGITSLGSYSDGGRLLKGPGDGVSDNIPATIEGARPARLADGEFVVPARIVSEIGNGSTDAGAKRLYAMMDRIQNRRSRTTGGNVAVDSRAYKELPA